MTCSRRLRSSPSSQRVYLLCVHPAGAGSISVIGLLKVGPKQLFLLDANCRHVEVRPLCVLDFWVHDAHQRQGHGKRLLDAMLAREGVDAAALAYDRPSAKFRGLLARHYGLQEHVPQMNHFVVFREFGLEGMPGRGDGRRGAGVALPSIGSGSLVASTASGSRPTTAAEHEQDPHSERGARRTSYGRRYLLQRGTFASVAAAGTPTFPTLPATRGQEGGSRGHGPDRDTTSREPGRQQLSLPAIPTSALPPLSHARWSVAGGGGGAAGGSLPALPAPRPMKQQRAMAYHRNYSSGRLY